MARGKKQKKSKSEEMSGMALVGFIMLGLAYGLYSGRPDVGVLAGLGLGFLAYVIVRAKS